jgi:hypothetical protein
MLYCCLQSLGDVASMNWGRELRGCPPQTAVRYLPGLVRMSSWCCHLVELDMSAAHRHLQDVHLVALATKLPFLEVLNVSYCENITDVGLQVTLATSWPHRWCQLS